jgi:hypothetical protein
LTWWTIELWKCDFGGNFKSGFPTLGHSAFLTP